MFRERSKAILGVIVGLLVILVVAGIFFVKKYYVDALDMSVSEYYEGISWGISGDRAKAHLRSKGFTVIRDEVFFIFKVENYGGAEGANGTGALLFDEEGKVREVMITFEADGEYGIGEEMLDKVAHSIEKAMDEAFDKKIDKEEMKEILMEMEGGPSNEDKIDALLREDIYGEWMSDKSYVSVRYYKGNKIYLTYNNIEDEYGQYLLSIDK